MNENNLSYNNNEIDSIWQQGLLYKLLKYNIYRWHLLRNNFQHVFPFNMLCERQLYSIMIKVYDKAVLCRRFYLTFI